MPLEAPIWNQIIPNDFADLRHGTCSQITCREIEIQTTKKASQLRGCQGFWKFLFTYVAQLIFLLDSTDLDQELSIFLAMIHNKNMFNTRTQDSHIYVDIYKCDNF